jgi:hypothetical protein
VFLIWGTSRYRGLTYCPFDDPTVGHPYVIGAVIAGSAALIAIGIERAVARRRWPTAAAVGLMMLALVCAAIYIAQSLSAVATGALTSFPLAGRAPLDFTLTVTVLDHSHLPRGLSYLDGAPLQSWIIRPRIVRAPSRSKWLLPCYEQHSREDPRAQSQLGSTGGRPGQANPAVECVSHIKAHRTACAAHVERGTLIRVAANVIRGRLSAGRAGGGVNMRATLPRGPP